MILEKMKAMEKAIKVAGSEVLEEILLIKEKGIIPEELDVIIKIIEDLMKTAENPHYFEEEKIEEFEEEIKESTEEIDCKDDEYFEFRIHEKAIVSRPGCGYSHAEEACKQLGFPEAALEWLGKHIEAGDRVTILAREKAGINVDENRYVIEFGDKKFLIGESGLRKIS